MNDFDYTYYRSGKDVFRIHLEQDQDAESPREYDNLSTLITYDRRYTSPDGTVCQDRTHRQVHSPFPSEYIGGDVTYVELRHLRKHVALFMPEILCVKGLVRDYEGTLNVTQDDEDHATGVAFVTREDWNEMMGPDYAGDLTPGAAIDQEVAIYNRWASGEYVGFVVEKREEWIHAKDQLPVKYTWEDTDSVWGYDDEKYALEQAVNTLPEGAVEINENEIDEEDEES